MADEAVGIANMALTMLGEEPILALNEDSKPARFCNTNYDNVRKQVLRAGRWNCATKRATLAQLADDPVWGFTRQFQLPSDFLRLNESQEPKEKWRIQGRKYLTDLSTVQIAYVFDLEDVTEMDNNLQDAIAAKLAAEICVALTGNRELMRDITAVYRDKLAEARYQDAQEGSIEAIDGFRWVNARIGADAVFRPFGS